MYFDEYLGRHINVGHSWSFLLVSLGTNNTRTFLLGYQKYVKTNLSVIGSNLIVLIVEGLLGFYTDFS
jgi:fluoride ion exporter CrcB/FEX